MSSHAVDKDNIKEEHLETLETNTPMKVKDWRYESSPNLMHSEDCCQAADVCDSSSVDDLT